MTTVSTAISPQSSVTSSPAAPDLLFDGKPPYHTEIAEGYALTQELLKSERRFTAVICLNDLMAMGAISALQEAGLRVPEDVSVMGFDDILFSQAWRPSITTMAVSKAEFGKKAFELLYTNIQQGTTGYYLNQLSCPACIDCASRPVITLGNSTDQNVEFLSGSKVTRVAYLNEAPAARSGMQSWQRLQDTL